MLVNELLVNWRLFFSRCEVIDTFCIRSWPPLCLIVDTISRINSNNWLFFQLRSTLIMTSLTRLTKRNQTWTWNIRLIIQILLGVFKIGLICCVTLMPTNNPVNFLYILFGRAFSSSCEFCLMPPMGLKPLPWSGNLRLRNKKKSCGVMSGKWGAWSTIQSVPQEKVRVFSESLKDFYSFLLCPVCTFEGLRRNHRFVSVLFEVLSITQH